MDEELTPEMIAIQEKREALAAIERGERPAGFGKTRGARDPNSFPEKKRRPSGWWALAAIVGGALLGALIGGAMGNAAYESDPDCFTLCGPGLDVLAGAFTGALFGAIAGLVLWALWALWVLWRARRRSPTR